jgi:hypothetical protein
MHACHDLTTISIIFYPSDSFCPWTAYIYGHLDDSVMDHVLGISPHCGMSGRRRRSRPISMSEAMSFQKTGTADQGEGEK